MAGIGVLTGLISSLPSPLPALRLEEPEILINAEGMPLHAGIAFGAGIALMLWLWVNRDPVKCLLVMALVLAGWLVAVNTAGDVFSAFVRSELFGTVPGAKANREMVGWLAAGLCGGAVGAGFTAFATGLTAQAIRRTQAWVFIMAAGSVSGLLLYPASILNAGIVLFVPWQAAVAACIAYGLTWPRA
ncbi:MAG: hypothetical protein ACOYB4_04005 [Methyloceanibacter sp.]